MYIRVRHILHHVKQMKVLKLFRPECMPYILVPWLGGLVWFGFMVFNTTFNNISAISWRSVLLMEETGGPGEKHRPVASH
jgi:hypothetical protein